MRRRVTGLGAMPALLAAIVLSAPTAWAANHDRGALRTAQDRVNDATQLVHRMKQNPPLAELLERARGVFIIPHYGHGGFIVGGQGGGGVVLIKRDGMWSDPAFFNIGGGSIGLQAGGAGGSVAMLLMTRRAVQRFEDSRGTWSLNANAGLTVVTYSGRAQANTAAGDIILWSDTNGLYGGLTAGVTHIGPDTRLDDAYYRHSTGVHQILLGDVSNDHADALRDALQMRVATR